MWWGIVKPATTFGGGRDRLSTQLFVVDKGVRELFHGPRGPFPRNLHTAFHSEGEVSAVDATLR
jgi:hypothetical protein